LLVDDVDEVVVVDASSAVSDVGVLELLEFEGIVVDGLVVSVLEVGDGSAVPESSVTEVVAAPTVVVVAACSVGNVVGADGPGPVLTVVDWRVVEVVAGAVVVGRCVAEVVVVGAAPADGRRVVETAPEVAGASVASVPVAATTVVNDVEAPTTESAVALTADRSAGTATISPERTRIAW
jgi:hypothetical protein